MIIKTFKCDKCGKEGASKGELGLNTVQLVAYEMGKQTLLGTKHWCRTCLIAEQLRKPETPDEEKIEPTKDPAKIIDLTPAKAVVAVPAEVSEGEMLKMPLAMAEEESAPAMAVMGLMASPAEAVIAESEKTTVKAKATKKATTSVKKTTKTTKAKK